MTSFHKAVTWSKNGYVQMLSTRIPRALWAVAVTASVGTCGFHPQPRSGAVACNPAGDACCPEGYVCVGRAASAGAGLSPGTCWYKEDLPLEALALTHDHTPAIPTDPACFVTDWLPGGAAAGGNPDSGIVGVLPVEDAAADVVSASPDLATGSEAGPVIEIPGIGRVTDIAFSGSHACVVVNGAAMCWGDNFEAELGDGTRTDRMAPVQVVGLQTGVTNVAAGQFQSCAVVNGGARCWGWNDGGKLGNGVQDGFSYSTPVAVVGFSSGVTAIAAGYTQTCGVVNGGAMCWGNSQYGQLGDGAVLSSVAPVQVAGLTSGVTAVAAGLHHSCAIVDGGLRCWGRNTDGQLGDNSTTNRPVPTQVVGLNAGVTAVAAGENCTCAVVNGGARCWGENYTGQLGDGTTVERHAPAKVVGLGSMVTAIATSGRHACAIVNGAAKCWGKNSGGHLGDGSTLNATAPVQVAGLEAGGKGIATGAGATCAIVGDGVKCWGYSTLGDGTTKQSLTPVDVLLP